MLLIFPVLQNQFGGKQKDLADLALCIFFSFIMLSSILVVWKNTAFWILIVIIGVPWILAHWLEFLGIAEFPFMNKGQALLMIVYSITMFALLMQRILSSKIVTSHTILNAISAYIFLGLIWASMYAIMLQYNGEALNTSINLEDFSGKWDGCVYYSFTTITTLGYGDITPATPIARSLSLIEAIIGPLYLTITIARLVGLYKRSATASENIAKDI